MNNTNPLNFNIMKLTKLMLSASIAALALVSCNKQDTTPEATANRLKSVEVSLENVVFTKGLAGDKIGDNEPIIVKNFQLFLIDGNGNEYEGKTLDGSAPAVSYWDEDDLADGFPEAVFHYVSPNCTKVVAVANMGDEFDSYAAFQSALENLKIEDQQDQTSLALYDVKDLVDAQRDHNDLNADGTTYVSAVYTAALELTPRVSRIEVDGFSVKYKDPANPVYSDINITQLAFQNYYPLTDLVTGVESGEVVNHVTNFDNQASVYSWLDTAESGNPWYRDYVDIAITPSDNIKDLPQDGKLAYHIFSGELAPQFIIKLTADGQPAYLYTKKFVDENGEEINEFQEGYIYRMSAAGEELGDGTIEIPEEKIDPMDRCLEITVTVKKWKVNVMTPEF